VLLHFLGVSSLNSGRRQAALFSFPGSAAVDPAVHGADATCRATVLPTVLPAVLPGAGSRAAGLAGAAATLPRQELPSRHRAFP